MTEELPKPWYRQTWGRLLLILCSLVVAFLLWKSVTEWMTDRALRDAISELDLAEPNWRIEDWDKRQPEPKPEENLATIGLKLGSRFGVSTFNSGGTGAQLDMQPGISLNSYQVKILQTTLGDQSDLPAELEKILLLKQGAFPLPDFRSPEYRVMSPPQGRQSDLRNIATMLNHYVQVQAQDQQPQNAIIACRALLHLAHSCDEDPFVITHFIRMALQTVAAQMMERTLAQTQPSPEALLPLQDLMWAESKLDFWKVGLMAERARLDRFMREIEQGLHDKDALNTYVRRIMPHGRDLELLDGFVGKYRSFIGQTPYGYIPDERLKVLRFYGEAQALAERKATYEEMASHVAKYRANSLILRQFGQTVPRLYDAELKRRVLLQMAAGLIAAERYRQAKGALPTGWNDLVPKYLPETPRDPYDNQPARWKTTSTGFILYCVGQDKQDADGFVHPSLEGKPATDVGLEFFETRQRRQAAAPPPGDEINFGRQQLLFSDEREQFLNAASQGDIVTIRKLLDKGIDINTKSAYGATALFFAVEKGHVEVVKLLLEKKIDLTVKDTFYSADAITWATMNDQAECVGLLLKAGAKGEAGLLSSAIAQNKPKMVAAILSNTKISQETLDSSIRNIDPAKTEIVKLLAGAGAKGEPTAKVEAKKTETPAKTPGKAAAADEGAIPTTLAIELSGKPTQPRNWPNFRGAGNAGIADGQFPPTTWDATTGKHLAWKTPIPGLSLACPIVWENKLFVTTAINSENPQASLRIGQYGDVDSLKEDVKHTWKVYCLDVLSGKVLWEQTSHTGIPRTRRHMKSSHANATPVTDGKVVIVNFGSEGMFCYNMNGRFIWRADLGKLGSSWFFNPDYEWGFGSSPVIYGDSVIVQCDIGKNSFIGAFNLQDGTQIWSTPREEIPSWCTPTIIEPEQGQPELVTVASRYARGYNPLTGEEKWKLGKFSEIAVPTPFYAEGLIYLTTGYRPIQPIYAVKPGGQGDLSLPKDKETSDYIAWSKQRGGPYLPTPIVYQGHLYVCSNSGVLSCYEAKTGKTIYQKRLGGANGYTASLVAADGRIYCTDEEGVVRVVKAGPEFKVIAINKLGEECLSHPAISNGRIFYRTRGHVMAFGLKNTD